MTEDEAFEDIERKQEMEFELKLKHEAQDAAFDFTERRDSFDLGSMTLRQAFEIGYRTAARKK